MSLLSGERLSSTDYNKRAEENIMTLIQENNKSQKKQARAYLKRNSSFITGSIFYLVCKQKH